MGRWRALPVYDPKGDAPLPRHFTEGWQLGTPDLVLTADADFILGPTGSDQFRCFVLATHLSEDQYIAAVEVRPSNPRVVHHTLQYIDTAGAGRKLELARQTKEKAGSADHDGDNILDRGPGYSNAMGVGFRPQGGMGGWAPGQMPRFLPDDAGYFLPKGADVVMQGFTTTATAASKKTAPSGSAFISSRRKRPSRGKRDRAAGNVRERVGQHSQIQNSGRSRSLPHSGRPCGPARRLPCAPSMPHMHYGSAKEIKVTMTSPGGKSTTLVAIREWD